MLTPARWPGRVLAAPALASVLLTGCSFGAGHGAARHSGDDPLPAGGCDRVACTGVIDGARYEIRLPSRWNGTLLLYSHGYRQAQPAPPDFAPVPTDAQVASTERLADQLLGRGYALAGSAYRSNGWAVADGVKAGEQLHELFVQKVGTPRRSYGWGDSLGGLITELLAERHPDWVSGAAPMCGVLGGSNRNLDLALDISYAVKTLIYPQLRLTGFGSHQQAVREFQGAYQAILAATRDVRGGVPKLLLTAALADAPTQTARFDGGTASSRVAATVEALVTGLGYTTFGRYDIEQRVGGNPSGNAGVGYRRRVSAAERTLIDTVSPGATDRLLALLDTGARVRADPRARARFEALGEPTGNLQVPTITLHTTADPLVLVQNETVFGQRVHASRARRADVVQLYTSPPARYPAPAPYGAGHCNFTDSERLSTLDLLDNWVRQGAFPAGAAIRSAFGGDRGLNLGYNPGPWPATGS